MHRVLGARENWVCLLLIKGLLRPLMHMYSTSGTLRSVSLWLKAKKPCIHVLKQYQYLCLCAAKKRIRIGGRDLTGFVSDLRILRGLDPFIG